MLGDVSRPTDLAVELYDGDVRVEQSLVDAAVTGERYALTTSGTGRLYIDPVSIFGSARANVPDLRVKVSAVDSPENMNEVLYRIYSLTNTAMTEVTRSDLLNGKYGSVVTSYSAFGDGFSTGLDDVIVWTAVTNDVKYKTTHLVMRKVPAKDVVWQIGSPADEPGRSVSDTEEQKYVKLTQDFYIGVFEITQAQFMKVYKGDEVNTPSNPSTFTGGDDSPYLPVNNVSYSNLRGNLSYVGPSGEKVNWPTNSYLHEVVTAYTRPSFLRDLRRVCKGVEFDLPFDPQWEFACRAGVYDKGLNDGLGLRSGAVDSDRLDKLGWYSNNSGSAPHPVGMLRPNAFGLYDMHGNVYEVLANWAGTVSNSSSGSGVSKDDPMVDPVGIVAGSGARTARGGGYDAHAYYCRNASRFSLVSYYVLSEKQGFRVVCPVGAKWEE
jgi:formylglycine-generating enzyme required for sulfatase activity